MTSEVINDLHFLNVMLDQFRSNLSDGFIAHLCVPTETVHCIRVATITWLSKSGYCLVNDGQDKGCHFFSGL